MELCLYAPEHGYYSRNAVQYVLVESSPALRQSIEGVLYRHIQAGKARVQSPITLDVEKKLISKTSHSIGVILSVAPLQAERRISHTTAAAEPGSNLPTDK